MIKILLLALTLIGCQTRYPTAIETSEVFKDKSVKKCEDVVKTLLTDLMNDGWQPSQPQITNRGAFISLVKGNTKKLIAVVDAARRWTFPESVEYLGFCITGGTQIGYVLKDTTSYTPPKPKAQGALAWQ